MALMSIAQPLTFAVGARARGVAVRPRATAAVTTGASASTTGSFRASVVGGPRALLALSADRRGAASSTLTSRRTGSGGRVVCQAAAEAALEAGKPKEKENSFKADIIAGISVVAVAIPQSCGYALLAGTTVKCALLAAAAAALPAALLGSSRYMQVGCLSLGALLTNGALTGLGLVGASDMYCMGASMLALYAGVTRLALGFGKLGKTIAGLPVSVLDGFVCGASMLVFSIQIPHITGAAAQGFMAGHYGTAAIWLLAHPNLWQIGNVALSVFTFVLMLNSKKRIHPLFPAALVCCIVGGALAANGINVGNCVGAISFDVAGLFPPAVLQLPKELALALLAPGIAIGVSTYLESAAVCKRWADEDGEEWDSDKELIAQGTSSVLSAFAGGMPVAGTISRAALGKAAGARTQLAHGVTGALLIAFIVFNGGALLAFLPKSALGALVACGIMPLAIPTALMLRNVGSLDYEGKRDTILAWVAWACTLLSAPTLDRGLLAGCFVALCVHLLEKAGVLGPKKVAVA